jgi:hypothetical protein
VITFKIQGSKYQLPTTWQDVTYQQYISLLTLPDSLLHQINLFTKIGLDVLFTAELRNLEKISMALSFLNIAPKVVEDKPTRMVGKFTMPKDCTIESLAQFEDLRGLLNRRPADIATPENNVQFAELCLEACAIYVQKIKDGKYDSTKVPGVKDELRTESCIEVIQTGGFFLAKPLHTSMNMQLRYQRVLQRLRRLLVDLPGYQKSLDFLQHSLRRGKG